MSRSALARESLTVGFPPARYACGNKVEFLKLAAKHLPRSGGDLDHVYDFYYRAQHWSINGEVPLDRIEYMQKLGLETQIQTRPVDLKTLVDTSRIEQT